MLQGCRWREKLKSKPLSRSTTVSALGIPGHSVVGDNLVLVAPCMRLLVHDFAGYPFPIQLSRELAGWGHDVTHAYPIGLQGPKGRLQPSASDPEKLTIRGIALSSS